VARRPPASPLKRNSARSRERILAAALREFSDHGLAGARVDRIARRARINKRMLYSYFGAKNDLYREVMRQRFALLTAQLDRATYTTAEDSAVYWFGVGCHDPLWVRLMEWEALDARAGKMIARSQRKRSYNRAVAEFSGFQRKRQLPAEIEPRLLLLGCMALTTFPHAFPQLTRLVTGAAPGNRGFQARWTRLLRAMVQSLRADDGRTAKRPGKAWRAEAGRGVRA
jgi:TetR/AcrR family transcriptional regulator